MIKNTTIIGIALAALVAAGTSTASAKGKTQAAPQVIYTGDIASKVIGYNGTTPLNIHIQNGKIVKIEALNNREDPHYLKRACDKVFGQYEGKTVEQARKLKADCATGATYTSEALIKNIQLGLDQVKTPAKKKAVTKKKKLKKK
ncbi:MAG TPA: FMN-binding protein [Porphyromonadaceae bacterium]|nr:FMN-binding protein [Porphyromonadaceae bacterium]